MTSDALLDNSSYLEKNYNIDNKNKKQKINEQNKVDFNGLWVCSR